MLSGGETEPSSDRGYLPHRGLVDHGIGERLGITLQTVYTHVQHVFTKLDLPATSSDNRRARAVVAYLTARQR